MTVLILVFAGLFGAAVGSFVNVLIHRVPRGLSLLRPPSTRPSCGAPIGPRDNIPILSYLLLGARCRSCGAPISVRYPVVEAATAVLWVVAFIRFSVLEEAAFVAVAGSVLLAVAAIDLEHRRIPNVVVLPGTAVAAVWVGATVAMTKDASVAVDSFASAVSGFVLLFVLAVATGGIGFGDVKLVAFIGLVTGRFGWEVFLLALFSGFVIGGLVAAVLLVSGRRGRKDAIPFGPSLAAGGVLALFAGSGPVRAWLGL